MVVAAGNERNTSKEESKAETCSLTMPDAFFFSPCFEKSQFPSAFFRYLT
jgi:hypothetical protein